MSYKLVKPGPPKPKKALGPDEGLTDRLVVASVLDQSDGARSAAWMYLGPDGPEAFPLPIAWFLATSLLSHCEDADMPPDFRTSLTEALHALRAPILARRSPR
jgi:hypothetical protein